MKRRWRTRLTTVMAVALRLGPAGRMQRVGGNRYHGGHRHHWRGDRYDIG